jgi:hypothetical protein
MKERALPFDDVVLRKNPSQRSETGPGGEYGMITAV